MTNQWNEVLLNDARNFDPSFEEVNLEDPSAYSHDSIAQARNKENLEEALRIIEALVDRVSELEGDVTSYAEEHDRRRVQAAQLLKARAVVEADELEGHLSEVKDFLRDLTT